MTRIHPRLILASASSRRASLLREAGYAFEILPTNTDESQLPGETPESLTLRLALAKARTAASMSKRTPSPTFVLGADTVVVVDSIILGKPSTPTDAMCMLRALSGRTHKVLTAVALIRLPDFEEVSAVETTSVSFARLTDEDIEGYVSSAEPFDKAGGYAIQGLASRFVNRVDGSYSNVVGLPMPRVRMLLQNLGWPES